MKPLVEISRHAALLLVVMTIVAACATPKQSTTTKWTRGDVAGLSMELVDPERVEQMMFSRNGYVSLTIGQKNGFIAGPLCQWRLVHHRLQIYDDRQVFEELTLVSRDASSIVARRSNGKMAKYRIL